MTDWTTLPRYKHYLQLRSEADKRVDIIISLSDSGNNEVKFVDHRVAPAAGGQASLSDIGFEAVTSSTVLA